MNKQKLMKVTYYDEKNSIRLTGYADTVVWDEKGKATLAALRFGGYPEEVRGLADAIYGGITIEIESEDGAMTLSTLAKQYRRVLSYDGVYAEATLIAEDDGQTAKNGEKKTEDDANAALAEPQTELDLPPRNTYIFCTPGDKADLFRAVDQKTAVPLIPEFQDYVLSELTRRKILRPLRVKSISRKMEAWLLRCEEKDKNIVAVLEKRSHRHTWRGPRPLPAGQIGVCNGLSEHLRRYGGRADQKSFCSAVRSLQGAAFPGSAGSQSVHP